MLDTIENLFLYKFSLLVVLLRYIFLIKNNLSKYS